MSDTQISIYEDDLKPIGENIKAGLSGKLLVLVIDTTEEIGESSTGKMMGVASTEGFARFPGELKGNVYIGKLNKPGRR